MIGGVDLPIKIIQELAARAIFCYQAGNPDDDQFYSIESLTEKIYCFALPLRNNPLGIHGASGFNSFLSSINFPLQLRYGKR